MIINSICEECEKPYSYKKKPSARIKKFCTTSCYHSNLKKNGRPDLIKDCLDRQCQKCGSTFHAKKQTSKQRFCSMACRGAWQSSLPYSEWKAKLSAATANRPRGSKNHMWGRSTPHGKTIKYETPRGETLSLRSSWEWVAAKYLDSRNIKYDYEPKRFHLEDRTYLPDFYLPEFGVYWEIKGWLHARHKETIDQFRRCFPQTPLVVIGKGSIKGLAKQINHKLII